MEFINNFVELFLHLDQHLNMLINDFGIWTYFILFLIIFCETGLVVTPFLPGDSLLFALGAFAARADSKLEVGVLYFILCLATLIGDTTNYGIGYLVGVKVFEKKKIRFIKKEYVDRTHRFYEKHGPITVTLARYIPIIRTFAPFVAGVGRMKYWRFLYYSVLGGLSWITIFIFGGYFFGNLPIVRKNFVLVITAIVCISVIPAVIEIIHQRCRPVGNFEAAAASEPGEVKK
jgi:membrane-associated protein